jgi:hypothetical protein
MKAARLIADALSDWRVVRDAPDLAFDLFAQLDEDELHRLALRAFTDEVRATLRRKVDGVPLYANVEQVDPTTGETVRRYKQTAMFDVDDYVSAIASCQRRADAERRTARALRDDCAKRLGVQLRLDGRAA